MSRECPEPRKDNRNGGGGGRGGFNSGGRGNSRGGFNSGGDSGRGGFNSGGGGGFNSGGDSGRGGFNSGGDGDRCGGFRSSTNGGNQSMSVTVRNSRNQNDADQDNQGDAKPTFSGWRGGEGSGATNGNDSGEFGKRTFNNSGTRGGFSNSGGFRGKRSLCFRIEV
jgi:hypothetical protein